MARVLAVTGAALLSAVAPAAAQVPATNDVAACTLLADPTAQRSCIESARQKRPATSFDPSAARQRGSRPRSTDAPRAGTASDQPMQIP